MSVGFVTVQWNKRKWIYDGFLVAFVALYLVVFLNLGGGKGVTGQILQMRAYGSCAFLMLTAILSIGPLARLDPRFLPLLYNRRHFGVLMCAVAVTHAYHVLGYYQAYGRYSKLEALFLFDNQFTSASAPFQLFGAGALVILIWMAFSSHDFWQKVFGPAFWKWLHMGVYLAFTLVVLHVAFGALQWEVHPVAAALVGAAVLWVCGLHLMAARLDMTLVSGEQDTAAGWLNAGDPYTIPVGRARPLDNPAGERIAVVRDGDRISAVHGVCAHQGGPLYEGKVIDGALTCPWHGWNYRPCDGRSPPPFTEKLPTYRVRLVDGELLVDPTPLAPGTEVEPVELSRDHG